MVYNKAVSTYVQIMLNRIIAASAVVMSAIQVPASAQLRDQYQNQNQQTSECEGYFNQAQYDATTGRLLVDSSNKVWRIEILHNIAHMLMGNFDAAAKAKPCNIVYIGPLNSLFNYSGGQVSITLEDGNLVEYFKSPRSNWQVVRTVYKPVRK